MRLRIVQTLTILWALMLLMALGLLAAAPAPTASEPLAVGAGRPSRPKRSKRPSPHNSPSFKSKSTTSSGSRSRR